MKPHAPLQPGVASRGRARRIALGLTVTEIAERMKLSVARICQLESSGAAHVDLLARWAAALEMPPGELAFGPRTFEPREPYCGAGRCECGGCV